MVGYNLFNTSVYALLFLSISYLLFLLLKKLRIKINWELTFTILPYVFLTSLLRVLRDNYIFTSIIFTTPYLLFLVLSAFLLIFSLSFFLHRKFKTPLLKPVGITGWFLVIFLLPLIKITNLGALLVFLFFLPWLLTFFILPRKWKLENKLVASVQLFDANVTYTAMEFFGYEEQHVLPTFLIDRFGPFSFVLVKAVAVITILYLIDKFCEDKDLGRYLKLLIGIIGGITSTRDFLCLLSLCYPH